jgi:hypothetical protein
MSSYADTQTARNSQYKREYEKWIASLSKKERQKFGAQGLLEPKVDTYHLGKPKDVSELPLVGSDGNADIEPDPNLSTEPENNFHGVVRTLVAEMLADPNPALAVECLSIVTGICFMGESMTEVAKRHGVTRAAVSKRCVQWANLLRLSPSRSMRRLTARKAYKSAQFNFRATHERFNSNRQ